MADYFWFSVFVFANVLLLTLLGINVSRVRISERIAHGDGGNVVLKKAIRAHGNGIEHVMVYALAILALQLVQAPVAWLATLVCVFTLARVLHAWGMLAVNFPARRVGAGLTFLLEIVAVFAVLAFGVLA